MKVLQVLPELNSGGVETCTLALARYLVQQGHQSLVLSNGGSLTTQLKEEGSLHLSLPVHKKSPLTLRHIPAARRLLQEHQPNILHIRSRAPGWIFYLAWKSLPENERPRLVTTVHGFYSVNFYSSIMCRGEKVICVSKSVEDYVTSHYPQVDPQLLHVIHEGINSSEFPFHHQPSAEWLANWHREFPQTQGHQLLVLPGRITRLKGHETFLTLLAEARKLHPQVHGVIAGGAHATKNAYFESLKQKAKDLGLEDAVTFTGQRSDLREILSIATISYSLSLQPESFGLTVLEALSLGTPVIGYNDGGVAEILHKLFPQGAVSREEPTELLKTTTQILTSKEAITPNTFFLEKIVHQKTEELYSKLL